MQELSILGAGPAGVAAAVEAARLERNVFLLDASGLAGGALVQAFELRNLPFPFAPCTGLQVAQSLTELLKFWKISIVLAKISNIVDNGDYFELSRTEHPPILTKRLIIATGTRAKLLPIPGLPTRIEWPWVRWARELAPKALYPLAVIGSSDVAFDQARAARARGYRVVVFCRSESPRAPRWLVESALAEGVELRINTEITSAEPQSTFLRIYGSSDPGLVAEKFAAVLPAVGREPDLLSSCPLPHASLAHRLAFAGDCLGRPDRFVVSAMSDGTRAVRELIQC